jgi:hypothetical protein
VGACAVTVAKAGMIWELTDVKQVLRSDFQDVSRGQGDAAEGGHLGGLVVRDAEHLVKNGLTLAGHDSMDSTRSPTWTVDMGTAAPDSSCKPEQGAQQGATWGPVSPST